MSDHAPSPMRLRRLLAALDKIDLTAAGDGSEALRRRSARLVGDYLLPRLEQEHDRIVVSVVGPGGSGKSAIVNALAAGRVSVSGPLRPTTLRPVVWAGPGLPSLPDGLRSRLEASVVEGGRLPPDGLILVDAPPPDVTDLHGEPISHQLLDASDAAVFVASLSRYADAAAFDLLERAASRGLHTVIVLNRAPERPEVQAAVAADFARKLAHHRLIAHPDAGLVTTVSESSALVEGGLLDAQAVAGVRKDLEAMVDPQSRPEVAAAAVAGSLRRLRSDLASIRQAVIDVAVERVELLDPVRSNYRSEVGALVSAVRNGNISAADPDRLVAGLALAATRRAGIAARATAEDWYARDPGLLDGRDDLFGSAESTTDVAVERLGFWDKDLEDLVERHSAARIGRRRRKRLASALRALVTNPAADLDARTRRVLRRNPSMVEAALSTLADELAGVLETDAMRFSQRLGGDVPDGILSDLVATDE